MTLATVDETEGLPRFLASLDPATATRVRTLARAWEAAGGELQVGRLSIRLVARDPIGRSFTAATLQARRLELSRALLLAHGLSQAAWADWCDERGELARHGFAQDAKFPAVDIGALTDHELTSLALGLRDIALAVCAAPPPL
ncbi:MAG: hypothetical protein QOD77_1028 [Thermoplasmata archaeon]|jgi:hypothetical protein|nr:hypothetical protein [Thermoplasmata archaeon]